MGLTRASDSNAVPGARPVLAELTAVCEGREVTAPKHLSRESTFLVFSVVADCLEAVLKGGSGTASAGLRWAGLKAHIKVMCFPSSRRRKPRKNLANFACER